MRNVVSTAEISSATGFHGAVIGTLTEETVKDLNFQDMIQNPIVTDSSYVAARTGGVKAVGIVIDKATRKEKRRNQPLSGITVK